MRFELCHYDPTGNYDELQKTIFLASHHRFALVGVPLGYFNKAQFFIDDTRLAAAIDYPNGNSPLAVRICAILDAAKKQVKTIDLVMNHSLIANNCWKDFVVDIKGCLAAARDKNIDVRAMIDYRLFEPPLVLEMCRLLKAHGITTIITSTGTVVDDFLDNLIIADEIRRLGGINVVLASNSVSPDEFKKIKEHMDVYAMRFLSANLVRTVFGTY